LAQGSRMRLLGGALLFASSLAEEVDLYGSPSSWSVVLDGVMGGRSTGSITTSGNVLYFDGNCNLNGGGFASIRRSVQADLSAHAGIVVTFETQDGGSRPIAWELQVEDQSRYSYGHAFANPLSDGRLHSVFLPRSSFTKGKRWGRSCNSCSMDWTRVREIAVYMLFQEGEYSLRLHSITAVSTAPALAPPPALVPTPDAGDLVRATINVGAPVYDKGYPQHCAVLYASALATIAQAPDLPNATRNYACAGIAWRSASTEATVRAQEEAWALRRAMNHILGVSMRVPDFATGPWIDGTCDDSPPTQSVQEATYAAEAGAEAPPPARAPGAVPVAMIALGVAGAVVLVITTWLIAGYAMPMRRKNAELESRVLHLEAAQQAPQHEFPVGVALGKPVTQKQEQSLVTNQAWGQESHAVALP